MEAGRAGTEVGGMKEKEKQLFLNDFMRHRMEQDTYVQIPKKESKVLPRQMSTSVVDTK